MVVVGVGKAAVPMVLGLEDRMRNRISGGVVITKEGHAEGELPRKVQVREAAHPIPDQRGVVATRAMLELLGGLTGRDLVIAVTSGGGSALLEAPRDELALSDIGATTDLLLRAGAPIQDLNAVRIPLSQVKGGGLRRAAGEARVVTLILSDVLGNDPQVIASGPTVFGDASGERALAILEEYHVQEAVPRAVITALESVEVAGDRERFAADQVEIVADNSLALDAVEREAERSGFHVVRAWSDATGEARDSAKRWVDLCADSELEAPVAILGGGELTVTVSGTGEGGRNTEFALAAALELEARGLTRWVVGSLATDGQDGTTGVAGAIADAETRALARSVGIDPAEALANNDSLAVFRATDGTVAPGPTGTNVNDLYFAVLG